MSFTTEHLDAPNPTEERRSALRRRFERLTYAEFGPNNGGILLDLSESGSRFQSVEPVFPGDLLPVSFVLTGSVGAVKAAAQIIWCNDSGKGGGLRFLELPEGARDRIGSWVSSGSVATVPIEGTTRREKEPQKFNLLTTEGHLAPEPASDAAALAMARLLVSARGSSKLEPRLREADPGLDGQPSRNISVMPSPVIDFDARPEALMATEFAAPPADYAEATPEPQIAPYAERATEREALITAPFVYEPAEAAAVGPLAAVPEEAAEEISAFGVQASTGEEPAIPHTSEPVAETFEAPAIEESAVPTDALPSPAFTAEVFAEETLSDVVPADEVLAEAARADSETLLPTITFSETVPSISPQVSLAESSVAPESASASIADAGVALPYADSVEPPAEARAVEATALESRPATSAGITSDTTKQAAEPRPISAPETASLSKANPAAAQPAAPAFKPNGSPLREAKSSAPSPTYKGKQDKHNKKTKAIQRNPMGLPSALDIYSDPRGSAKDARTEPRPVPHWGVQVLRFAVGVGVGCCLVAGTFVGLELLGPGHRTFSLARAGTDPVEAAAPSLGQPLDAEVVDLSGQRWHLSDNAADGGIESVDDRSAAGPQLPIVELTPADPSAPRVVPSPDLAAATPRIPLKPQQSLNRKSGSRLLTLQRPRVTRKAGGGGDLRAPSITEGIVSALPSTLSNTEPRRPAPVATEASRSVFPSVVGVPSGQRVAQFQGPVLIEQVSPIYPPSARQQRVTGTVRVNAIIGKEGIPHSLRVISGDARLAPAALAAVSQWLYRPAQIDGEVVESETTISVEFQLR